MTRTALVLGAAGPLGAAMAAGLWRRHQVIALTRRQLDIASAGAARSAIAAIRPAIIVNCAAYTRVDAAEREPALALDANAWGVRTLARLASDVGATLVHFSTDFIFDGTSSRPYLEDDPPNPRSAYASSKLLGEWFAQETPRHYVLRVESLFGGPNRHSSVDRLLDGILAGADVPAFVDRTVSPSFIDDVVAATAALIDGEIGFGTYHCVNSGWTTWSELARELAGLAGRPNARIVDIRMADAGLTAERPRFAALSNAKLAGAGIVMPTWQDALARYVATRK
jgi:dTDP-4-dehydrorhamnose reductase